ncbi:hypothetical protein MOMMJLID_CDS0048 [Arthrobacter phage 1191A]|nr:hypothetical protein MOMMJLID_CDS0048 [Arthrobacter phage 1191A]
MRRLQTSLLLRPLRRLIDRRMSSRTATHCSCVLVFGVSRLRTSLRPSLRACA